MALMSSTVLVRYLLKSFERPSLSIISYDNAPAPDFPDNINLSFYISSWYYLISVSLGSSLIFGLFWILFALLAYLRVLIVSSKL